KDRQAPGGTDHRAQVIRGSQAYRYPCRCPLPPHESRGTGTPGLELYPAPEQPVGPNPAGSTGMVAELTMRCSLLFPTTLPQYHRLPYPMPFKDTLAQQTALP